MESRKFGARLRELREQAGLSQRELADKVGVNFTYLSKIESEARPSPSEKIILRLAEVLGADRDELMTLAGKLPSDIAQMLKNRENWQLLSSSRTRNKTRSVNREETFNTRLRKLREQAGLSQRELANKVGVNFTYLSKIERGVMPPPSEGVMLRLAEVLGADRDELMTLAGKIPSNIAQMFKDRQNWQLLRAGHTLNQKRIRATGNREGIFNNIMKHLLNNKRLAKTVLATVLAGVVAVSLWFSSPAPVRALKIEITDPQGQPLTAGALGQTYYFQTKVTIENGELLPIQNINLSIFNSANVTLKATLTNLPLVDGGSANYTAGQTGGGTANVTATASQWARLFGYGYAVWQGYAYQFGYGYGYGAQTGPAIITYTIAWTPPTGWPAGNYKVEAKITANGKTFTQLSSDFALQGGLVAETSIAQALDASKIVVVRVNIDRIKDPSNNTTANITGGIGSYTARLSSTPSSGIEVLAVRGVAPFDNPTFDNVTGIFSATAVAVSPQANNTTVAELVLKLTGNATTPYYFTVAFQTIRAAGDPGLNVPEANPNTVILLRGDVNKNGQVSITDSLALQQYLVGQLTLAQINPLNAASPHHDGPSGDKIRVLDVLVIEQYLVGQRDAYYNRIP